MCCPCLGIFHCYMEYADLKGEPGANVTLQELGFQTDFSVYLQIRQTWLAFSQYTADNYTFDFLKWLRLHDSLTLPLFSDYPGHCGSHHNPATHFPQEENSAGHCSHQRSQQVRIHIRAFSFSRDEDRMSRKTCQNRLDFGLIFLISLTHSSKSSCQNNGTDLNEVIIDVFCFLAQLWTCCCVYRAIGHVISSIFYPLFTFLLLAMVIAYWAVTAVYPLISLSLFRVYHDGWVFINIYIIAFMNNGQSLHVRDCKVGHNAGILNKVGICSHSGLWL